MIWHKTTMAKLSPETAHIFRITHVKNVPWILDHGIHCMTSNVVDPAFVPIGMPELIVKRATRTVPIGLGGSLADYVPFYFTPWSVMMYNIRTGHNGVIKWGNAEIAILVSSMHKLQQVGARFAFTNAHAYMQEADYFEDLADLNKVDWPLLRSRNFQRDPDDPGKLGRYQAEALVHRCVPVDALLGIACYDSTLQAVLAEEVEQRRLAIDVKMIPGWYF